MRGYGLCLVAGGLLAALAAPWLAPHAPDEHLADLLNAPPTMPRIVDDSGHWRAPFIYPWRLVDRLQQQYQPDRTRPTALVWFTGGHVIGSPDDVAPLLLLGTDSYGRDVFSRLLFGARISLGLSVLAALGSVLLGSLVGACAGYLGGATDEILMRGSELVLVLPAMYVTLALRAALPLILAPSTVFVFLFAILSIVGSPLVARGVRGIIRAERRLEYSLAATSLGAGHARLLGRHLLPATVGFIAVQLTLLVPAFIVGEATLSYVGLGFPDPVATWGTMLHEASNVRTIADFPWLLSPAAAMFLFVLGLNLVLQGWREPRGSALVLQLPR